MQSNYECPYLDSEVELTQERERHILQRHPDLPTTYLDLIADTLSDPDEVRCDLRFENMLLFSRWFPTLRKGSFAIVAVVTDTFPLHFSFDKNGQPRLSCCG